MYVNTNDQMDFVELSKMFHEIKNPLALISSSLQIIEKDHPEVKEYRFWTQTMKDMKNLCLLINELSSLQKGNIINKTKIDLLEFLQDLLESTTGFLLEKGSLMTIRCSGTDVDFFADETKLRQAVINLIKNAAESGYLFGPKITLRFEADDTHIHISVEDQGEGMSEETLSKIFEPFHTTKSYGTGLGIPIVKKIAESHGGSLSIQSREGAGTTAKITLPLS